MSAPIHSFPPATTATVQRLFIALPIPELVRGEIERVQDELRRALPKHAVRWSNRDQFHLTLRFLGNVETTRVAELTTVVCAVCQRFPSLKLRAERIGCFPDLRFPRVVWVWVHDETDRLAALQKAVAKATGRFVMSQAEEKFTGHVTIARTHQIKRPEAEILAKLAHGLTGRFFGEWIAEKVQLMRSELLPSGARHSEVADFSLGGLDG